jgi:hypothetical protein
MGIVVGKRVMCRCVVERDIYLGWIRGIASGGSRFDASKVHHFVDCMAFGALTNQFFSFCLYILFNGATNVYPGHGPNSCDGLRGST